MEEIQDIRVRLREHFVLDPLEEEIAEREGVSVQPVKDVISDFSANLPKNLKPSADHLTDFDPPIYNVWKQQEEGSREKRGAA